MKFDERGFLFRFGMIAMTETLTPFTPMRLIDFGIDKSILRMKKGRVASDDEEILESTIFGLENAYING